MKLRWILPKALLVPLLFVSQDLGGQGTLVFNGGFDASAAGWILTNGAGWAGPDKGNPGGFVDLDSLAPSAADDPTASQLINGLIPGQPYLISGDYQKKIARTTVPGPSFGVALGNVFLFEASDPGDFLWHSFSFPYMPASTSTLLSLSAQINGTGVSYSIDNIAMYGVPEPSVLVLSGLGSLSLAAHLFHRARLRGGSNTASVSSPG